MRRAMLMIGATVALLGAAGACNDDNNRLSSAESRLDKVEAEVQPAGSMTVADQLAAEVAARKQSVDDALHEAETWAMGYTDKAIGTEAAARMKGDADEAAARAMGDTMAVATANSYTDQQLAAAIAKLPKTAGWETHLMAPGGVDLGIYVGGTTAWTAKLGLVDYGGAYGNAVVIVNDSPNCSGKDYLSLTEPVLLPTANVLRIGRDGALWKPTGAWVHQGMALSSWDAMGKCQDRGGTPLAFNGYPAMKTANTAAVYDPAALSLDVRPAGP